MVNEEGRLDQVDNDGSIWAFTPGDGVEIELVPDDGYEVYIADVTKAGEKHLVYRYGDDGESLHISDAGQDELFFEVLDLADTANEGKVPDGTIFVCYEKIYIEQGEEGSGKWVLVADHEDFWDESQRIYMPYIDTTALDQKTEEHISYAGKDMKIYDTVHYEAVRPEYTYKLVSELRDTATGEIVVDNAGKKHVITTYFKADFDLQDNQYLTYGDVIPENHEGSGMTFDVDAEIFAGRTLVVYERMYLENGYGVGRHLVAEHQVLLDEDQTIRVPKVWTSAIDSGTFTKTPFADGLTTIIDTFSYENLIPGFTYELKGYIFYTYFAK